VIIHPPLRFCAAKQRIKVLEKSSSYSRQSVVCVGVAKEAVDMRTTLEDLYYGNIIPNEQQMTPGSELKRAVDRVAKYEKQLMEQLEETEQETLTKLIRSQHEINSITATENFILGFRLGVRIMAECMDDNDGDIRNGGE
jgi:hypothetical protein